MYVEIHTYINMYDSASRLKKSRNHLKTIHGSPRFSLDFLLCL